MLSFRTHMERHERRSEQVRSASTKGQEAVTVTYRCARVEDTIQGGEKSNDRIYTASDTLDHVNSDLGPGPCGGTSLYRSRTPHLCLTKRKTEAGQFGKVRYRAEAVVTGWLCWTLALPDAF